MKRAAATRIRRIKEAAAKIVKALLSKLLVPYNYIKGKISTIGKWIKRSFHWFILTIKVMGFTVWASDVVPPIISEFKRLPSILPSIITDMLNKWIKSAFDDIIQVFSKNLIHPIKGIVKTVDKSSNTFLDLMVSLPSRIFEIMICPFIFIIKKLLGVDIPIDYINYKCYGNDSVYKTMNAINSDIDVGLINFFNTFGKT
jgi:hypothetical protein